jgi:cytochrome c biogenesis protein CcmG/thiol:disulfide interchange protein DsbE
MRRLLYILPVVLLGLLAALAYLRLGKDPSVLPSALIDRPAPEFALPPLLDGVPGLATADLKGQVALVNVFASWCAPCRVEHPVFLRLKEEGRVAIYGINYKDKPEDATAWLQRLGNPYTRIGADREGRAAIEWGVYGVPETFVIDREGRIRYRHVGPVQPRDLEEKILPLLSELQK